MNAPIANRYDTENAAELCRCAGLTYGYPTGAHGAILLVDTEHLLVAMWESETDVIIAFRGTANIANALADMDAIMTDDIVGRVHEGFAHSVNAVTNAVMGQLLGRDFAKQRIWLTGHSLGGAMAHLFAARLVKRNGQQPFAGIYTFGQPRVGNAAYRDWFNYCGLGSITFRVVYDADIVPHVPWFLGSYRHSGHEVLYLVPTAQPLTGSGPEIDPPFFATAIYYTERLAIAWCKKKEVLIADHHVGNYIALYPSA